MSADNGPGIPEQVRTRLFEPFAGSSKPAGNGLGLAICRELMRAHGGEIELSGNLRARHRISPSPAGTPVRARARAAGEPPCRWRPSPAIVLLPFLLVMSGCRLKGPALAGYPGLQNQIVGYYDNNALEQNATCTQPRMRSVTGTQIIDETPEQVVMAISYYWLDEGQID